MREEWSKSCDVITFCVNRFWGLFGFSFQVKSNILLCSPQVITFKLVISKPYRAYPNGKFDFENLWLNTLRWVADHFKCLGGTFSGGDCPVINCCLLLNL